nr:zinc finger, BED-type, phospholipase-like, homeodomain-like protein [Tanacetum cinerariifolium]
MATQSTLTSVGVGSSNEPTIVEVIETTRNKDIWQHYDLCKMSDGSKKGRCKQCSKFIIASSNSTLRLYFEKPYCPVRKIIPDGGLSSMSREGGLFVYEADRVRQQFAGFVIQQASESAFLLSGRVLSIRRTRLTPASLEMCICLKDHLEAQERIQHTLNLKGGCLEIEEQLLEVEAEAGYANNIADKEINLEEQAMSGSATNSRLPGRLVAGDTNPGRHVARDKLKGKARHGYFPRQLS